MSDAQEKIKRSPHNKENPYVMISKQMLLDKSISPQAKGVLSFILSKPDNWHTHPRKVAEEMGVGKDLIYSSINELLENGYATKETIKGENGRFDNVSYEFYENKINFTVSEIPTGDLSSKPDPVKSPLSNTDLKEERKQQQAAAVFPCLKDQEIPHSEKEWLTKNFSEETVSQAVLWSKTAKISTTLVQALKWACANPPEIHVPPEDMYHENFTFAKQLEIDYPPTSIAKAEATGEGFLVAYPAHPTAPTLIKYTDKGFKESCLTALSKFGLKRKS